MSYHLVPKKRVEFVIDAAVQPRLTRRLEEAGQHGYTVLPAVAGQGSKGAWSREGGLGAAGRYVRVVCDLDEAALPPLLDIAADMVRNGTSHVTIFDVQMVAVG